jgi:hypothetical protein
VACSRGRELCSVHTPDKAALMSHLPEGNRRAALDVLAADPRTDLSIQLRSTAYRKIIADVRRTHAQVNRRTEQMRRMVIRHNEQRQRVANAERVVSPRHAPAESERQHFDFKPVQSQRTGIGL